LIFIAVIAVAFAAPAKEEAKEKDLDTAAGGRLQNQKF